MARYRDEPIRRFFRADALFANPQVYEFLEAEAFLCTIRLPGSDLLYDHIRHLLTCPVGRPPKKPIVWYHSFSYQAGSWDRPRWVVAKVEWHQEELVPESWLRGHVPEAFEPSGCQILQAARQSRAVDQGRPMVVVGQSPSGKSRLKTEGIRLWYVGARPGGQNVHSGTTSAALNNELAMGR